MKVEYRVIQLGLKYEEKQVNKDVRYHGYVNKDGQREGVGIRIFTDGFKDYAEWHLNNIHGVVKVELPDGSSWWGEYKDDNAEGYGTVEDANGGRYIG